MPCHIPHLLTVFDLRGSLSSGSMTQFLSHNAIHSAACAIMQRPIHPSVCLAVRLVCWCIVSYE